MRSWSTKARRSVTRLADTGVTATTRLISSPFESGQSERMRQLMSRRGACLRCELVDV